MEQPWEQQSTLCERDTVILRNGLPLGLPRCKKPTETSQSHYAFLE
jgi:hypothetical protein